MTEKRNNEMNMAGMIHEDYSAPSNLPQNVKHSYYPSNGKGMRESLNDTISGIDSECRDVKNKMNSHRSNSKW